MLKRGKIFKLNVDNSYLFSSISIESPFPIESIFLFKIFVLESRWTYLLWPLHSYVQWPISRHFWHLILSVAASALKIKKKIVEIFWHTFNPKWHEGVYLLFWIRFCQLNIYQKFLNCLEVEIDINQVNLTPCRAH